MSRTSPETETVERLLDDAFSVLQHDADETQAPEKYAREALRRKFTARLNGAAGLAQSPAWPNDSKMLSLLIAHGYEAGSFDWKSFTEKLRAALSDTSTDWTCEKCICDTNHPLFKERGHHPLCPGGIDPGFDACPKCGATMDEDCAESSPDREAGK